jgi:hypothetical protein
LSHEDIYDIIKCPYAFDWQEMLSDSPTVWLK